MQVTDKDYEAANDFERTLLGFIDGGILDGYQEDLAEIIAVHREQAVKEALAEQKKLLTRNLNFLQERIVDMPNLIEISLQEQLKIQKSMCEDHASITANNIMNDIINLDIKGEDCGLAMDKVYENIMKLIEDRFSDQWQDISTAPKDASFILVGCTKYGDVDQAHWDVFNKYWRATGGKCKGGNFLGYDPDIWRPMPTPPKVKEK